MGLFEAISHKSLKQLSRSVSSSAVLSPNYQVNKTFVVTKATYQTNNFELAKNTLAYSCHVVVLGARSILPC
jgi:hypothetical protein